MENWKVRNERTETVRYTNGGTLHEVLIIDIQSDPDNRLVTQMRRNKQFEKELRTEANLIANAPALLKALQSAIRFAKHNVPQADIVQAQIAQWQRVVDNSF